MTLAPPSILFTATRSISSKTVLNDILSICRNMVFVSYIHVLSAAFLIGLAAAAPMGPVNMLAIRRGVIGGWRHTLACGIGAVTGDLTLFSLVLLGGHYLFSDLSNPMLQTIPGDHRRNRPASAGDLLPCPHR